MSIKQIGIPDLSSLVLSGATVYLLEALNFSEDGKHLVIKATFTEDTAPGVQRYGYFLYDVANAAYVINFNETLFSANRLTSSNIDGFSFTGDVDNYNVIAQVQSADSQTPRLVHLTNTGIASTDVLTGILGDDYGVDLSHFILSEDGRYLAVQTEDESISLASDTLIDANAAKDIYLLDLLLNQVTRVSEIGGAETNDDVFLKDIRVTTDAIEIAFTTDAYFVSPSRVDINSVEFDGPDGSRTDAYLWQSQLDNTGKLIGEPIFQLLSLSTDGVASGYVDKNDPLILTPNAQYFSSKSALLTDNDINAFRDSFVSVNGNITSIKFNEEEFQLGSSVIDSSSNGRYVIVLSSSPEVSGSAGVQQLVFIDTLTGLSRTVSQNSAEISGDSFTVSGAISNSGSLVAFTSLATNLSNDLPEVFGGSLFIREYNDINSLPTGELTLTGLPIPNNEIELNLAYLVDADGISEYSVDWYRNDELVTPSENTLLLAQNDVNNNIRAVLNYTDDAGNQEEIGVDNIDVFPRKTDDNGNLDFTAKYIVFESTGENVFDFNLGFSELNYYGQSTLFSGSSSVDSVRLSTGQILDFTNAKSSIDKIYLPGRLTDYLENSSIDNTTGVMTLISTADFTYTEIKFIGNNVAADELVFSDGKISSKVIKEYLSATSSNVNLSLSNSETYNSPNNETTTAKVKAISLDDNGENFTSFSPGIELQVSGGAGIDKVYIKAGTIVDATNLKSSIDEIYCQGTWSDYEKSFNSSGNLVLTREVTVDDSIQIESVTVSSGSTVATNDLLVFADGSIRIKSAVAAIREGDISIFEDIVGYDDSLVTPINVLLDADFIFPSMSEKSLFTSSVENSLSVGPDALSDKHTSVEHSFVHDNDDVDSVLMF